MEPIILPFEGKEPQIGEGVFLAPGAAVIGDVAIGKNSSVWFGCVVRGDDNWIRIGENTNIQDGTVVHVTYESAPTSIGNNVTIGHGARLHGCTLEDGCLVGIGAVVLDGAVVEEGALSGGRSSRHTGKKGAKRDYLGRQSGEASARAKG